MVSVMTSPFGVGVREVVDADVLVADSTADFVPGAFRRRKVWGASALHQPFAPTPWIIAISVSALSALTGVGFPACSACLTSSSVQLANSLLISARPSELGLRAMAMSSDPSPLKSPTRANGV